MEQNWRSYFCPSAVHLLTQHLRSRQSISAACPPAGTGCLWRSPFLPASLSGYDLSGETTRQQSGSTNGAEPLCEWYPPEPMSSSAGAQIYNQAHLEGGRRGGRIAAGGWGEGQHGALSPQAGLWPISRISLWKTQDWQSGTTTSYTKLLSKISFKKKTTHERKAKLFCHACLEWGQKQTQLRLQLHLLFFNRKTTPHKSLHHGNTTESSTHFW